MPRGAELPPAASSSRPPSSQSLGRAAQPSPICGPLRAETDSPTAESRRPGGLQRGLEARTEGQTDGWVDGWMYGQWTAGEGVGGGGVGGQVGGQMDR